MWYAHSKGFSGKKQPLSEHLKNVMEIALGRCPDFLRADVRLAALFHDFGKYSELFQRRLEGLESGLDHWSPGAFILLGKILSKKSLDLAGLAVHAHHVGLGKWDQVVELRDNLTSLGKGKLTLSQQELYSASQELLNDGFDPRPEPGCHELDWTVGSMLDARMVLSALVHGDYTDTARHKDDKTRPEVPGLDAESAFKTVKHFVDSLGAGASPEVLKVRRDLWDTALEAAEEPPGMYELEAPTGSGKTLAMLGFALRHIAKNKASGLRRIIVALPYLSILDQTVKEYRKALKSHAEYMLEHHSLAEWRKKDEEDGESEERKIAEAMSQDWEAPIIITTTVQLFESLFTDHPATTRKLCALSKAVILLDEAQSLPQQLITPTLKALSRLCHPDYGSTVVVATATQPLFSRFASEVETEPENAGWRPVSIAGRALNLYDRTRRYDIDWSRCEAEVSWESIADELAQEQRALCIVNTRKDARNLAELVKNRKRGAPVLHLSTNMCAAHRKDLIEREELEDRSAPCLLISTQCVEAGVDLDFPVLYRALAPLDSIAQAAGRCNRAGAGTGHVRVFNPAESTYPGKFYEQGAEQTRSLLELYGALDPQNPDIFKTYFERLYSLSSHAGTSKKIELAIMERDFAEVAKQYRLIERKHMAHIIVPYAGVPEIPYMLNGDFFRRVQPYVVDANYKDTLSSDWTGSPLAGTDNWYVLYDKKNAYSNTFGLRLESELPIVCINKEEEK